MSHTIRHCHCDVCEPGSTIDTGPGIEESGPCDGCKEDCEGCADLDPDPAGYVGPMEGVGVDHSGGIPEGSPIIATIRALKCFQHGAPAAEVRAALHDIVEADAEEAEGIRELARRIAAGAARKPAWVEA